jgi:hypothetical protein
MPGRYHTERQPGDAAVIRQQQAAQSAIEED